MLHATCTHKFTRIMQHAHAGGTTSDEAQKAHSSIHHIRALRAETCRVYNGVTCTCILLMFDSRGYTTHQTRINNIHLQSPTHVNMSLFCRTHVFCQTPVNRDPGSDLGVCCAHEHAAHWTSDLNTCISSLAPPRSMQLQASDTILSYFSPCLSNFVNFCAVLIHIVYVVKRMLLAPHVLIIILLDNVRPA